MPWFIIIIGLFFLLKNLDLLPWLNWPVIWPAILILTGLYLIKKKSGKSCCGWFAGKKDEIK